MCTTGFFFISVSHKVVLRLGYCYHNYRNQIPSFCLVTPLGQNGLSWHSISQVYFRINTVGMISCTFRRNRHTQYLSNSFYISWTITFLRAISYFGQRRCSLLNARYVYFSTCYKESVFADLLSTNMLLDWTCASYFKIYES